LFQNVSGFLSFPVFWAFPLILEGVNGVNSMYSQNISNSHAALASNELNQGASVRSEGVTGRVSGVTSHVLGAVSSLQVAGDVPNIQRLMSRAFAAQRSILSQEPSSSNDSRLLALNALEARGFQASSTATLSIPLSAKGMGGVLTDEQRRNIEIQQGRVTALQERVRMFSNTARSQATLLQQYTEAGDVQAVSMVRQMLQTTRTSLFDSKQKLAYAQQELARVELGAEPSQYASTNGIHYPHQPYSHKSRGL
jgi:hypothetical protein